MPRTFGETKDCNGCRFWSEMIAKAEGGGPVEALCLSDTGPNKGKYVSGRATCEAWASGHHGAVDDPPNYGEETRALYKREATERHPNGQRMWADDGTLLDEHGNRSIFDDVDE